MSSRESFVNIEKNEAVATVTFGTPAHNALPGHLLIELANTLEQAGTDPAIKVIALRSAGNRTFCAGASFDELVAIANAEQGRQFFMGFAKVILAMRAVPQLVVALVQGKAVGGGVGLAAAADYCIATSHSAVKLSELSIGIGPFVISPAVQRKVGVSAYGALSIDPTQFKDAAWALKNGLYMAVKEDLASAEKTLNDLVMQLSAYSAEAIKALKRDLWRGTEDWPTLLPSQAEISGRLVLSAFTKKKLEGYK